MQQLRGIIMGRKELKTFFILDIIEFILAVIGLFVFTLIFAVVQNEQRFLFLICDLYAIYVFIKNWNSISDYFKTVKMEKNKTSKIKMEGLKKISF